MKGIKLMVIPLIAAVVLIGGCSESATTSPKAATTPASSVEASVKPTEKAEASIKPLDKEEVLALLAEAATLDNQFDVKKSKTEEDIYSHYDSHYTRNYVKKIVLEGGNLKKQGEHWVIAHEGGEYLEGTFMNEIDKATLTIEPGKDGKSFTVTNSVGDGLYAPHKEVITIVHTGGSWKIDSLKWVGQQD